MTVTGSGDALLVNDAGLVCGGVKTANATVYMIDTVLMPPAGLSRRIPTGRAARIPRPGLLCLLIMLQHNRSDSDSATNT